MATVDEIVRRALPPGSAIVAGEEGAGRRVEEVLILRPRPPGLPEARGNELIILSLSTLQALDDTLTLARSVDALAYRASALAVRGDVPPDAQEAANRLALPLIALPAGVTAAEVERGVIDLLTEERNAWYRRRHTMLHDLAALAVRGEGVETIVRRLGEATGYAVLLLNEQGERLAAYRPAEMPEEAVEQAAPRDPAGRAGLAEQGFARHAIPVAGGESRAGMLVLATGITEPSEDIRAALEAGATAAGIELSREQAVRDTVTRIQGDLVADILSGRGSDTDLEARAQRLGHDLRRPHVALAVDADTDLSGRLPRVLQSQGAGALVNTAGGVLTVFLSGPSAGDGVREAERLLRMVKAGGPAGISEAHAGAAGLRRAAEEAAQALAVARIRADEAIVPFRSLGVYRLLLPLRGAHELRGFYEEMLGPLLAYDLAHGSALIETLEAYLASPNATEAAGRLSLHRNSLLYRLRRIREISGLQLDDPETRLALLLAIKIGPLLEGNLPPASDA